MQTIFIDFDKTISPIHGFTEKPTEDCINCIKELYLKYKIVIFSCRANNQICDESDIHKMINYLHEHDVPFHAIQTDKPLYDYIIDDRSINPVVTAWKDILDMLQ